MFGCIIDQSSVADFFIQIAKGKLTQSQIDRLNNELITGKDIDLYEKNQLLRFIEPNEKYYARLKEIVETENNPYAVIALARFKKDTDIRYISSLFKRFVKS